MGGLNTDEVSMPEKERRRSRRYSMHLPIIISSPQAIETLEGWHYGEILDAGKEGIRMRVESFKPVSAGEVLQMVCQPALNRRPNDNCMPVPIKGKVIWSNEDTRQFALQYSH